ncbi:hypothetical protein PSm6_44230 [Pseudomonas solani]|uniref:Restriction alleviation protein Lar n=1 Tax=Pseudomonas solani TaxID=2731552 RepID=A0ABM7LER8_9PSED|nr:Lar family restriction alleviation protein [Pseudomonas solani]BCD88016.1 hypothetical protein PSm6_44230 [Pseudomonas solani]
MSEELKPCPFCGETPDLPSGDGTYYVIECGKCGWAVVGVQISDLMTIDERQADPFTENRYAEQFIERAKAQATELWGRRATPPAAQVQGEKPEVVAWRYGFSGGIVSDKACLDEWKTDGEYQPLMTVAQHERIVAAPSAPPAAGMPAVGTRPQTCNGKRCGWCKEGAETCHYTPPASEQQQAVVMPKIAGTAIVEVVNGVEGPSLYIGNEDGGYRLAGPKPWGGGRTIHKFTVKLDELVREAMDLAGVNQGVTTEAGNGGDV